MTAETVVFFPRRTRRLISPIRSLSPGWTALSRLDFPAPEGPVTTEVRPSRAPANSSMPCPVRALVGNTVYPAARQRSISSPPGSTSTLLTTTAAGMELASATTSKRSIS
jgi:hypothetical protein